MKRIISLFAILFAISGFSQSVNDYKYVVVQNKFDFQKEESQYNLNNLVKMMFEKYGFEVYFEKSQKPDELALNRCKALYADVQKSSGFLTTNITIALNDCTGKTLFTTQTGKSKEKDFKKAYYDAVRKAAASFDGLNYSYNGGETAVSQISPSQQEKTGDIIIVANPKPSETLYAQVIPNGYQLVDSKPQVVLRIYKTSQPDSFTAISDKTNGVVFKKDEQWYFEYYLDDKLISEKLDIKF